MNQSVVTAIDRSETGSATTRRVTAVALGLGGLALILLALTVGKAIEDQLAATGMPDLGCDLSTAQLAAPFVPALDLGLLGLLCFAVAAWNLCGSAAMPSFLLMPERLAALQTLPFATGQMKSVLALLALGWVLLLIDALLAVARLNPRSGED